MNNSIKAALLSALIFPGVGQISAGYKQRGWIIVGVNVMLVFLIIREIMKKAYTVIAEMQKSGSPMDIESVSNATSKLAGFSDNIFLNILLILLVIFWLYSIFDAYRAGKK